MTLRTVTARLSTPSTSTPDDTRAQRSPPPPGRGGDHKADFLAQVQSKLDAGAAGETDSTRLALFDEASGLLEQLKSSSTSGTDTQAVIEQLRARLDELGISPAKGQGRDRFEGPGGPRGPPPEIVAAAAEALGMDEEGLQSLLAGGDTLSSIATSQGVSEEDLTGALTPALSEKFPDAAQEMLAAIAKHMINGTRPERPAEHGKGRFELPAISAATLQTTRSI